MAQTALRYAMLRANAYWTGSYGDEELRFDESSLGFLLITDELCTVLLPWAWSDVYHDRLDRAGAFLKRVRQYNSRARDVSLNLYWVSGVLAHKQGNLPEARSAFDEAISECPETSDLLTFARVGSDAGMASISGTATVHTTSSINVHTGWRVQNVRLSSRKRNSLLNSAGIVRGPEHWN